MKPQPAKTLSLAVLAIGAMLACAHLATPQEKKKKEEANLRLFEREPFEELHVREGADKTAVVKIRPLEIEELPKAALTRVKVKLLEDGTEYSVQRSLIVTWKRFRELILEEAERLAQAGKFDEAYYYYDHLRRRYRDKLPQLDASTAAYHVLEAKSYLPKKRYAQALALLNTAYDLNAKHPGLGDVTAAAVEGLVRGHLELKKYDPARSLLAGMKAKFPSHPTVLKWQGDLSGRATKHLTAAQAHLKAGRLHEAREEAFTSVRIWPLDEAKKLLEDAQRRSPRLVVGVTLPAHRWDPQRLDDWAARRSGRLLHRTLLEFTGHGPQGGAYRNPLGGRIERRNLGQTLILRLNDNMTWSDGRSRVTGADVCRHLLAMANSENRQAYRADWAEVFSSAVVRDVYEVQIDLRRAHVHPDGFLQTVLVPWHRRRGGAQAAPTNGPYTLFKVDAGEARYRANEHYFAAGATQPQEIIERYLPDGRSAVRAIRNGEVAVLDRVNPWEIETLRAVPYLRVEPYAVPTVHCLVPNPNHKLLARRSLRRAILSGIHRERILKELLHGDEVPGNQIVSGPFPKARNAGDPIGYAYDEGLAPRPFDRGLAITLLRLAIAQENAIRKHRKEDPLGALKPLVLQHPPHDVARVACRAMRDQLKTIGIEITLKETSAFSRVSDDVYDLKYVELALWEPIIDAPRLLGPGGVAAAPSAYLVQALRELGRRNDWKQARYNLLEVHRLAHEELSLIPLWQMTDHFAYHQDLKGISGRLVSLYQDVEQWQTPPAVLNLAVKKKQ